MGLTFEFPDKGEATTFEPSLGWLEKYIFAIFLCQFGVVLLLRGLLKLSSRLKEKIIVEIAL